MMQENIPQISIVIPVYNVAKYLCKCVESVLNQTFKDIEIILVDDGSTDQSGELCDTFTSDARVRVIHKENGGLSDARNAGTAVARADYVGFVDSDDYIENDMYEILYSNIINEDADISFCGIYDIYATGARPAYAKTQGYFTTDAKEAIKLVLHGQYASVSAVNKLYRKELLLKHPFLVGKTSEDAHFTIPYLCDIQKAVFDMRPKYNYVHREGTITTKPFRKSDLSIIEAYLNNRKIIERNYPDLVELADFRYYWSLFYIVDKMLRTNSFGDAGEYREVVGKIRREYYHILKNKYVGRARKIAVSGLMIHKKLYEICLRAYLNQRKQLVTD